MKWLAIALMLCGVGINQSFFFASVAEMLWESGTLFPASLHHAARLADSPPTV